MALTHIRAKIARPGTRRSVGVQFLVDTGAVYTVLPERTWRALRLKPDRTAEFVLADGTTITRGVSECRFTVQGQSATSPVVLGGPDDAPLLGAVTLETLGLMVNPLSRELQPMRLMLASSVAARGARAGSSEGPARTGRGDARRPVRGAQRALPRTLGADLLSTAARFLKQGNLAPDAT